MKVYAYTPYGKSLCDVDAKIGFSSEMTDDDTKLVYYNYRYYAPLIARWIKKDPAEERQGGNMMAFIFNTPISAFDYLGLACCGGEYYFPLLFGYCDLGSVKHVYSRITDCCIEGEAVYSRLDNWDVKICFSEMGLVPIPHAWIESGNIARGYYAADKWWSSPAIDIGIVQDEEGYFRRTPGFSIWGGRKICIPVPLRKCAYDISKFNDCLANIQLKRSIYTLFH